MVSAAHIEAELISAGRPGAALVTDMSTTIFCDCTGARAISRAVYRAGQRPAAAGSELRLVITTAPVRRLFSRCPHV